MLPASATFFSGVFKIPRKEISWKNKDTKMVDNRNPSLLSVLNAEQSALGPSYEENVILEADNIHCYWKCDISPDIKAVITKIASYMQNPEVNGRVSILENFIIFDRKTCSKIDGLQTVLTNFACVVPVNLNTDVCGLEFEIDEIQKASCTYDKLFAVKVTGHGQIHKLLSKSIERAKQTDSDDEVNLLSSQRMEMTFLKSVLHKSINKIEQDGALKTSEGRLVHLCIKDRASFVVLDVGFVEKNDELKTCQFSLIPSARVTPCQHLLSYHRPKTNQASKKHQEATEKNNGLFEIQIPNVSDASITQHLERMWAVACLERHSSCPERNAFSAQFVLALEVPYATNEAPKLNASLIGRSLSTKEAEHCENIISPASRLLLEYYYRFGHIPEAEMQAAGDFVMQIIQNLEKSIKADLQEGDPVVKEFFRSGSTAEGLKVCSPNEFDIMIPVDISQTDRSSYSVICQPDFPLGYAICKINSTEHFSAKLSKCVIENRLFEQLLSPQKLAFGWFQGLVQRAINKQKFENPSVRLKVRRKGPALMLEIQSSIPGIPANIDVDLVLAIEMTNEKVPRLVVAKASSLEAYYKTKLQEKKFETQEHVHLQDDDLKCFWRISYSVQEKLYLEIIQEQQIERGFGEGCQIVCLKILKTIREREVLKKNSSVMGQKLNTYLLKTCLYHVLATKSSPEDWSYERLAERYLDVFNFFLNCLDDDMLPHFFYESKYGLEKAFPGMIWNLSQNRVNLLDELHTTLRDQIYARMMQIRDSFEHMKRLIEVKVKECCSNSCQGAKTSENAKCLNRRSFHSGNVPDFILNKICTQRKPTLSAGTLIDNQIGYLRTNSAIDSRGDRLDGGDFILEKQPAPTHCSERSDGEYTALRNADANSAMVCECIGHFFKRVLPGLLQNRSLEQVIHSDFEATPWCKRMSSDTNRAAEIARKMVKETRKNGINDFQKLKVKCTEEVEKIHERDEESDDEYYSDYYDYF